MTGRRIVQLFFLLGLLGGLGPAWIFLPGQYRASATAGTGPENRPDRLEEEQQYQLMLQRRQALDRKLALLEAEPERYGRPGPGYLQLISAYLKQDSMGNAYLTGIVQNNSQVPVAMPKATAGFTGRSGENLGSFYNYIFGGANVQTVGGDFSTNQLNPGNTGFFNIFTNIPFSSVAQVNLSFLGYQFSTTPSNANLQFYGSVEQIQQQMEYLYSGNIYNQSSSYFTYNTMVAFGVYGTGNTYLQDVRYSYVSGNPVGDHQKVVQPQSSAPFRTYFPYASQGTTSGNYLSSFEWDEALYNPHQEVNPPFGGFDTPADGAAVAGSIPVTGWVLDDAGISSVKIYQQNGGQLLYIGDAAFVEGARPDIQSTYPGYPANYQAGWGYMMLTYFLPGGGNGTYTLVAIAQDQAGKTTTLGSRTIYCDNAHAVKPFGAIDTPAPGGTASGTQFSNQGWVLTPQPNSIPTNGSTINVWVDGVNLGHPDYNQYRADIATLFPGYANTNGAAGYFYFDTSKYNNGIHTIQWTATDNGGNADGIGSRYFSINNSSGKIGATALQGCQTAPVMTFEELAEVPACGSPLCYSTGYGDEEILGMLTGRAKEGSVIEIGLNEPLAIHLNRSRADSTFFAYVLNQEKLQPMPVGSTLDTAAGIFYWIPMPGFKGDYTMVFLEVTPGGMMAKYVTLRVLLP